MKRRIENCSRASFTSPNRFEGRLIKFSKKGRTRIAMISIAIVFCEINHVQQVFRAMRPHIFISGQVP
jgi:hypothetical protein